MDFGQVFANLRQSDQRGEWATTEKKLDAPELPQYDQRGYLGTCERMVMRFTTGAFWGVIPTMGLICLVLMESVESN